MNSHLSQLNTQNPQHLVYKHEEITFTILGGIRLEGLDRLRITLKAEFKGTAIRHNLDLYNDSQAEKLIRKLAERFEIGTVYINKALGELVNQLENYRLTEIKKHEAPEIKRTLTENEKAEAKKLLEQKNLLQATNDLIAKSGMIGEEQNRMLMFLIFTSRKREHPLHIISLASSGTGKSYLQERVSELMPEEDRLEITTLSENALYYFGQRELKHKLILIEDLDGAENVLYPLRELKSKRKITKTVTLKDNRGNTKTVHLTVEGPVCVAGCTTKESIYEDNANRSFLIYLDESKEQDERVMQYQRKLSAGTINIEEEQKAKTLLQNAQRILNPLSVKNPFAEYLQIPGEVFKARRTNAHYLQFIEAITFYKQYQRQQITDENTGEVFIETAIEDIAEANEMMKEILLRKADELSGACRNYLEKLKTHLQSEKQTTFTNKEIRKMFRLPGTTVRRYHNELLNNGYIHLQEDPEKNGASQKAKGFIYQIASYEEYRSLQNKITTALDEALQKIKCLPNTDRAGEPTMSHSQNGSLKKRKANKLEPVSQNATE